MKTVEVVVGRVGRAHGVRGDFAVIEHSDEPDIRFAPGAKLRLENQSQSFEVVSKKRVSGRLIIHLAGVNDRDQVAKIQGKLLVTDVDATQTPNNPNEFYDRQLIGLRLVGPDGIDFGEITEIWHPPAQDVLVAGQITIPFVSALVDLVDIQAGKVLLTQAGVQVCDS